jgi:hypothetical protein
VKGVSINVFIPNPEINPVTIKEARYMIIVNVLKTIDEPLYRVFE